MQPSRRAVLSSFGPLALAGCVGSGAGGSAGGGDSDTAGTPAPGWYDATLTDVNSGAEFTIAGLDDRPVLLETFAVWCSNCLAQQKTLIDFHERVRDAVHSVALNVDLNEDASKVRTHTERHGFEWRYAIAPASVTESLRAQFGQDILVPPEVPMVLVCPDGSVQQLRNGHKDPAFLESAIGRCE